MNDRMKNCNHKMSVEGIYDREGENIGDIVECEYCGATPEMILIHKLKLERLMWKAYARAEYASKMGRIDVAFGWHSLSTRCSAKLKNLKK